jgi:N-acylneuraminate cytidylyltransferase
MDRMVTTTPEIIAVIPARGGSQGIPRKNLVLLGRHPLLAWSIAAARQSSCVKRVLVSTDDSEIADVARSYGAEVPFLRPAELAAHDSRDFPVFQHAVDWLEHVEGYSPDIIVQLRPTSPLRTPGLVDAAIDKLIRDDCADSVRTVTPPSQNPYKMWSVSGGALSPLLPSELEEPYNAPRQILPVTYWQTGHLDAFWKRTIRQKHSLTGDRILPLVVDPRCVVDIDAPIHVRIAEDIIGQGDLTLVKPARPNPLTGVRLIVFDFDGVFTDNRVYVDQDGRESVACSRADGLGIARLLNGGFTAAVLSSETNPVVLARCRKLQLEVRHGLIDKSAALRELAASRKVTLHEIAYVGNDINDVDCLNSAGVAIVPSDAHPSLRASADLVLRNRGGDGAVREVCDLALEAHGSPSTEGGTWCEHYESVTVA